MAVFLSRFPRALFVKISPGFCQEAAKRGAISTNHRDRGIVWVISVGVMVGACADFGKMVAFLHIFHHDISPFLTTHFNILDPHFPTQEPLPQQPGVRWGK